ncbi:MAG: hypothetical protein HZA52_14940 [Planctomycetes bacterium]|nr:hypothetical protein [Planctomycetota bacterium]
MLLAVLLAPTRASAQGHDHATRGSSESPAKSARVGDVYLLDIDAVDAKPLGPIGAQIVRLHEGREFRFSSKANADAFEAAPAKYIAAVDAKMVAHQRGDYPLETCLVSGEKLGGEMGDPIDYIYGNRLVRFCCQGCIGKFGKDPKKFLAQLDAAVVEKQHAAYSAETCVVSGEKLGAMGEPIEYVVGNRLVRLCCKGCVGKFEKDPLAHLAKLAQGAGSAATTSAPIGAASYTCPMHADVIQDKAGRCPKCGMDLVKKE